MFTKLNDSLFAAIRGEFREELPAGAYRWNLVSMGMTYQVATLQQQFPKPFAHQQKILDRIDKFLELAEGYARLGLTYKRGFLLHGLPGCGKTTVARLAARKWANRGGIVLVGGPESEVTQAIKEARKPVLVLIDDVDEWDDAPLTHAMDGLADLHNVVWVATTNHIKQISDRLQRPGRFDEVLEIAIPPASDMMDWVMSLPITQEERQWVLEHGKGGTPSEVRELVIRCHLLNEWEPIAIKSKA